MVNYSRKQIPIINILIHVQQSINENHIGGIMVSMFSLSAVDRVVEARALVRSNQLL